MDILVCIAMASFMIIVIGCWLIHDNDKYKKNTSK